MTRQSRLQTYVAGTKERNLLILDELRAKILDEAHLPDSRGVCILVTGSDGRLEKGFWSKPEPIIVHSGVPETAAKLSSALLSIRSQAPELVADFDFELKDLSSGEVFCYAYNQKGRSYPQRIWDSKSVFGDKEVLNASKDRVVRELRSRQWAKIKDDLSSIRKNHKRAMESGRQVWKGTAVVNYDFDSGISYFCNFENAQARSFKHGPLRFVQSWLVATLAASIREGTEAEACKLIADLPTPTDEKIKYLFDLGKIKLSQEHVSDLIDAYNYFLLGYHNSELAFSHGQSEVRFDQKEVRAYIEFLVRNL